METQNNIFSLENTGFLNSAAFVALPSGEVFIFSGPLTIESVTSGNYDVFCPYFYTHSSWNSGFRYKQKYVYSIQECLQKLEVLVGHNFEPNLELNQMFREPLTKLEKQKYVQSFDMIQQAIAEKKIEKAVPTLAIIKHFSSAGRLKFMMMRNVLLALQNGAPGWGYGYWDQNSGMIGLTPEILFLKDGVDYQTMALAGTLPWAGEESREAILNDIKNNKEHDFVVADISSKLSRYGVKDLKISPRSSLRFRTIVHLKTDIAFRSSHIQANSHELIKTLHPTAALGLFSSQYDHQWMQRLPCQSGRRKFGSPLYFKLDDKREIALVTLRNIQWQDDQVCLESGGGVVESSNLEGELDELQRKRQVAINIILGAESRS